MLLSSRFAVLQQDLFERDVREARKRKKRRPIKYQTLHGWQRRERGFMDIMLD